jgi:penicillin-insensitive murein endopeptidase
LLKKSHADSKNSQSQYPLTQGDGCDAKLDWWFTAEAKKPAASPLEPLEPVLPVLCDSVLKQ